MDFNGAIGESHLKNKTKQPARRTKMLVKDMEYQAAVKDYEQIVLEHGYNEVLNIQKEVIMEMLITRLSDWGEGILYSRKMIY